MPITRKKRATSPEQADTTTPPTEASENSGSLPSKKAVSEQAQSEGVSTNAEQVQSSPIEQTRIKDSAREVASSEPAVSSTSNPSASSPSSSTQANRSFSGERQERHERHSERQNVDRQERLNSDRYNGDRVERQDRQERQNGDRQDTSIESGRRTVRGELFRRPPQGPQVPQTANVSTVAPALQPPSHEISLPLGNLLHLAYNPGFTGSDEARSQLLELLVQESKKGGRARCWNCGSIAIIYDRWNTRSKTFGEVGIAFCEICGVWSVL